MTTTTPALTPRALAAAGPVIPVIVIDRVAQALPLAEALLAGGVRVMEVTLRTPAGLPAIEAIARALPEVLIGAGTLRSVADAEAAAGAGARFGVSPGFAPALSDACARLALPLLPGVSTATEVMAAQAAGHELLKFFPAEAVGGMPMLKALQGPFPDIAFCPTGGVGAANASQYLALPNVAMCGGSWLTPADALRDGDWARVTRLAREAAALRA
ncbi:MAG: bifunctional 4-hydroxy-2-oxoglutarate aldolase/2-dehydro-3-deoxy-phosphogluconate aldolase [Rubrivivax sp.]